MKMFLTLCLVLFLFTISTALATETRVLSMGDVNDVVKDDANISLYPQSVVNYGGLFTVESSDESFFRMGANWALGESVLGAYFSEEPFYLYHELFNDQDAMDQKLSLIYGRALGENPFGILFNYYGTSFESDYPFDVDQSKWSLSRLELAAGVTLMEGKLDLSAGFGKSNWTDEGEGFSDTLGTLTAPDGASTFGANFRYWLEPRGKWQVVPHGHFTKDTETMEYYTAGTMTSSDKVSNTAFTLGLGTNYQASERVMTVTDFGFMAVTSTNTRTQINSGSANTESEYVDKYKYLPFFKVGLDAEVRNWLDLRCGVRTAWRTFKSEDDVDMGTTRQANERSYKSGDTEMYLGFGAHWGSLAIDGFMNNASFLHNGPYFISGNSTSGGLAGRLSLSYKFD